MEKTQQKPQKKRKKYRRSTMHRPWNVRMEAVESRMRSGMAFVEALALEDASMSAYYCWKRKAKSLQETEPSQKEGETPIPTALKRPSVVGRLDYDPRAFKNLQNDYDDLDRDYQDLLKKVKALESWQEQVRSSLLDIVPVIVNGRPLENSQIKRVLDHVVITIKSPE